MLKRLVKIQLLLLMVILTLNAQTKVMSVANKNGSLHNEKVSEIDSVKFLTDYVEDVDGNVYKTIMINGKKWMAENLRVTHYNNGTPIPYVSNNADWGSLTTGAYCCYDNDVNKVKSYGCLYNWYAVNTGKLAPADWHVPSEGELEELNTYLADNGHSGSDGTPLKSITGWSPVGIDIFGFNALPAGWRNVSGYYEYIGSNTYFWSTTKFSSGNYAWTRELSNVNASFYQTNEAMESGCSVRCVMD